MAANCPSGSERSPREDSNPSSLRCSCGACPRQAGVWGLVAFPGGHLGAPAPHHGEPRARGPSTLLFHVVTRKVAGVMGLLIFCKVGRCLTLLFSITAKPKLVRTGAADQARARDTGVAVSTPWVSGPLETCLRMFLVVFYGRFDGFCCLLAAAVAVPPL